MLTIPNAVQAQWVKFEACGLVEPNHGDVILDDAYVEKTRVAPHIGPAWVWVPAVHSVIGFTEKNKEKNMLNCTLVYTTGNRVLVIGSLQEVMNKLKAARR
jgi:hypothetical protein